MPRGKAVASQALVCVPVVFGANAALLDSFVFVAQGDYELVGVSEAHDVAGSDGGSVTLDVVKCASGTTVGSGTSMLASTFDLKSTADTPVRKTISNGGISTAEATRTIRDGEALALNFTGTLTALVGVAVTIWLKPRRRPAF